MTVVLPSLGIADATPYVIDTGGVMRSTLGGPDQRLNRMGARWGCEFKCKPMKGDDARVWVSRLVQGMREKARIKFPQPGWTLPYSGNGFPVNATEPATVNDDRCLINLMSAGQLGKEGQFFSAIVGGKYYVHQLTQDAAIEGARTRIIFQPLTRVAWPAATVIDWTPMIEGYVIGDPQQWNINNARIYGLSFKIEEAE